MGEEEINYQRMKKMKLTAVGVELKLKYEEFDGEKKLGFCFGWKIRVVADGERGVRWREKVGSTVVLGGWLATVFTVAREGEEGGRGRNKLEAEEGERGGGGRGKGGGRWYRERVGGRRW